jgi:uncharacterized protein (TIGR03790 family)
VRPASSRHIPLALGAALILALVPAVARAQTGANLLVVANGASELSVRIAEAFARSRAVPGDQVLRLGGLAADPDDDIERGTFAGRIEQPIARWLSAHSAQDRITAIVLTKGVPLRIRGTGAESATTSSVDSELTLLYRRMTGARVPVAGSVANPYFQGEAANPSPPPFTHAKHDIYLVTRLDGYTEADVLGLIARGRQPAKTGRFVLDQKASLNDRGNDWLQAAADRLTKAGWGDRVLLENSPAVATAQQHVLGYYSWGSNDAAIKVRHFGLQFEAGAIGGMFVSTDGRTFREPPADWRIGSWDYRAGYFAGSPQSLAGDLIREGITGVAGHVAEPYLRATIRPDILFPAYIAGRTLAEAFYLAMPALSWQTVVVGDPLCAPFQSAPLPPASLDPGVDPATELPRWFSERRLAQAAAVSADPRAVRLVLRAETHDARNETSATQALLEQATALDSAMVAPQLRLASLYEAAGEHQKAIERYRAVLARKPDDVRALNNLAFALAVHAGNPAEALGFAQRAHTLAPDSPGVTDTLGWILALAGRPSDALPLLEGAAKAAPDQAEILLHLASVRADLGRTSAARAALEKALALDPGLATRPEAVRLSMATSRP